MNSPSNPSASAVSSQRTKAGSCPASGGRRAFTVSTSEGEETAMLLFPFHEAAGPPLQRVDSQKQEERSNQHDRRNRRGSGVIVLLQLGDNQQRSDLRFHGKVAGDENHRAILTQGTCKRERETRE